MKIKFLFSILLISMFVFQSEAQLFTKERLLNNENFDLNTGVEIYENLGEVKNNDRYQFVFPYYDLSFSSINFKNGLLRLDSSGNSRLN